LLCGHWRGQQRQDGRQVFKVVLLNHSVCLVQDQKPQLRQIAQVRCPLQATQTNHLASITTKKTSLRQIAQVRRPPQATQTQSLGFNHNQKNQSASNRSGVAPSVSRANQSLGLNRTKKTSGKPTKKTL
jgi:hypothetical protein